MRKKLYILFTILIVIIITLSLIFIFNKDKNNQKPKKDYGTLIDVTYSCSGDMLGNIYSISLDVSNKKITYRNADSHNDPIEEIIYKTDDKKIKKIEKLITNYSIPDLDKLKIDDHLFVYDACQPSLSISFKTGNKSYDKEYYSISYYYNVDKVRRNVLNQIRDELTDLLTEENIIDKNIIEEDN